MRRGRALLRVLLLVLLHWSCVMLGGKYTLILLPEEKGILEFN